MLLSCDSHDDAWAVVEADYAAALAALLPPPLPMSYSTLADALRDVARAELPERGRPAPGWFVAKEPVLRAAVEEPVVEWGPGWIARLQ